jgi:hypothetical protein
MKVLAEHNLIDYKMVHLVVVHEHLVLVVDGNFALIKRKLNLQLSKFNLQACLHFLNTFGTFDHLILVVVDGNFALINAILNSQLINSMYKSAYIF